MAVMGCSAKEEATDVTVATETVEENNSINEEIETEEDMSIKDPSVDVDLTTLSSTMVYSEVFNMMMEPIAYEGQTIKMDGNCAIYTDEENGNTLLYLRGAGCYPVLLSGIRVPTGFRTIRP